MQEIARQATDLVRAEYCVVYSTVDADNDVGLKANAVYVASCCGHDEAQIGDEPSAEVAWSARYLRPQLCPSSTSSTSDVRNSICVPMIATQNRVLGVIRLVNKRNGGWFTDADLRSAVCLARVATTAVDRARLFDRIEQWTRSMETLLSFNATVNQHLEPREMVRRLVANVTGFLDADGGAAGIVFNVDGVPVAECDSLYHDGKWHPFERQWKSKEGIPGTVLENEFPFLVNDYSCHPLADPQLVSRFHVRSCICVPIKNAEEKVLGFFKLHRLAGKAEFTWQDAAFLESLGNTAAVAIENARLVQSLDRKNRQVKNLSQAHVRRLEEERKHIARELHDETGQVLIGLKLRLQLLSGLLNDDQEPARKELDELRRQVNEATVKLKDLAKRLRPPTLDELGFEATLKQLLAEYRRQVGDLIEFEMDFEAAPLLSPEGLTALYRIAQESLTNVIKHSAATRVTLRLFNDGDYQTFSIEDNGCGFDAEHISTLALTTSPSSNNASANGLGLIGISERVKMIGGQFQIHSKPGHGTRIEVHYRNHAIVG